MFAIKARAYSSTFEVLSLWQFLGLTHKHLALLENLARDKHQLITNFFIVLSPAGVIIVLCQYENLEHTTCTAQHFNSAINYGLK
jgi:hypothetical protein